MARKRRSYQRGSLEWRQYKRGGGCWTVRYNWFDVDQNEEIVRRTTLDGCTNQRDRITARRKADIVVAAANQHNDNPKRAAAKVTLRRFIDERWLPLVSQKLAASTLYGYESLINLYVRPLLGDKVVTELTPADMTTFFQTMRAKYPDRSEKYLLNIYSLLSGMLDTAEQFDYIFKSPLRPKLHRPQPAEKQKPTITVEQAQRMLTVIDPRFRLMLLVLWVTGARIGEVIGLRWLNFDQERKELSITNAVWRGQLKGPKTEASKRKFRLPELLAGMLTAHRESSPFNAESEYIFSAPDGRPYQTDHLRKYVLYPAMEAAGIERGNRTHGFHVFRHTVGTLVHSQTGDVQLVKALLGHADISTTSDIYLHTDSETVGRAVDALWAMLDTKMVN